MFSSITLSKIKCHLILEGCIRLLLAGRLTGEASVLQEFQLSLLFFFFQMYGNNFSMHAAVITGLSQILQH